MTIAGLLAAPAAIGATGSWWWNRWRTRRHLHKVLREPHHFDTLDRECIRIIGLRDQREIDHINGWGGAKGAAQKERVRRAIVRAYERGTSIEVLWQRVRGWGDQTHILDKENGTGDQVIAFYQDPTPA